jgi:hypothetical protein
VSVSDAIDSSLADIAREFAKVVVTEDHGKLPLPLLPWPVTQAGITVKAPKADDAEAEEVALWDAEVVELFPRLKVLSKELLNRPWCEGLHNGQMCWWKRSIPIPVFEIWIQLENYYVKRRSRAGKRLGHYWRNTKACLCLYILGLEMGL